VEHPERVAHGAQHFERLVDGEGGLSLALLQVRGERHPRQQLHREVVHAAVLADGMHGDEARVAEGGHRARLLQQRSDARDLLGGLSLHLLHLLRPLRLGLAEHLNLRVRLARRGVGELRARHRRVVVALPVLGLGAHVPFVHAL
jgi:hypothetical protein